MSNFYHCTLWLPCAFLSKSIGRSASPPHAHPPAVCLASTVHLMVLCQVRLPTFRSGCRGLKYTAPHLKLSRLISRNLTLLNFWYIACSNFIVLWSFSYWKLRDICKWKFGFCFLFFISGLSLLSRNWKYWFALVWSSIRTSQFKPSLNTRKFIFKHPVDIMLWNCVGVCICQPKLQSSAKCTLYLC